MSTELFIHKSLLPFLLWLALCMILLRIVLEALARLKQLRRCDAVSVMPVPPSEVKWVDQAMDNVISVLEQDETLEWRAQYRVVEEAELVAEQHQASLKRRQEG